MSKTNGRAPGYEWGFLDDDHVNIEQDTMDALLRSSDSTLGVYLLACMNDKFPTEAEAKAAFPLMSDSAWLGALADLERLGLLSKGVRCGTFSNGGGA